MPEVRSHLLSKSKRRRAVIEVERDKTVKKIEIVYKNVGGEPCVRTRRVEKVEEVQKVEG